MKQLKPFVVSYTINGDLGPESGKMGVHAATPEDAAYVLKFDLSVVPDITTTIDNVEQVDAEVVMRIHNN